MSSLLINLLKAKWYPPVIPTTSFAGKSIVLTGGTSGLGLEAAIKFVSLGASNVIIGARNPVKAQKAKETIEGRTHRHDVVRIMDLDMDSFSSIKLFAETVNREVKKLDIALLNAGLMMRNYKKSAEGWEETLQVNTLSTALLALLLLPKLKASGEDGKPTHLAITSSTLHKTIQPEWVNVDGAVLEHLNSAESFSASRQYNTSKLLVEFIVKEIAALASEPNGMTPVIVNSLCPGFCYSELGRSFDTLMERMLMPVFYAIFARSTEHGSRTLVSGTSQGVEAHGTFWKNDTFEE